MDDELRELGEGIGGGQPSTVIDPTQAELLAVVETNVAAESQEQSPGRER